MKIKDAIELLKNENPQEEIVIAWWDREAFPATNKELWNAAVDHCDRRMDWSYNHEVIQQIIEETESNI